jgi:hypothetical protein
LRCQTFARETRAGLAGLALWALVNGGLVARTTAIGRSSRWRSASRRRRHHRNGHAAGADAWLNFLRYCGEHSIVIYLAFFLPMAVTRTLLLKTGVITDIGTISLIVTVAGVAGAVVIWRLALALRADFLFERPEAFWIAPKKPAPYCRRRVAAIPIPAVITRLDAAIPVAGLPRLTRPARSTGSPAFAVMTAQC